jgi:hypothetical protein
MKQIKIIMLYFALAIFLTGCVTNNGDIGLYYGSWALDAITIDGSADASWNSNGEWTTWSFQNNIVCISRNNELGEQDERWGTWTETDGKLLLDYRHSDDNAAAGTSQYAAPSWIYIAKNVVTALNIESQTSKVMTLSQTDGQGRKIVYTLRKTH